MFKSILSYSISRPITIGRWFNILSVVLIVGWAALVTIINVAAVAYELVPFTSTSYNETYTLWYERLIHRSSWLPQTRTCDGSIIKLNEAVSTNETGLFSYTLAEFIDVRSDTLVDGLLYNNALITDCLVYYFVVSQSAYWPVQDEAILGCNTTAAQTLVFTSSRESGTFGSSFNLEETTGLQALLQSHTGPLDILTVVAEWSLAMQVVLGLIAPPGEMSLLLPSVFANNLTTLRLAYFGIVLIWFALTGEADVNSLPNTPAADTWNFYVGYTPIDSISETLIPITFLPTGDIDTRVTSNTSLATANNILAPTTDLIRTITGDPQFDIWKLFNWIVVSYYWIFLFDLGQTAPTYYNWTPAALPNFTAPVRFTSQNNIFVNDTLFQIYSSYLLETIAPFLKRYEPSLVIPTFLPLSDNNSLNSTNQVFLRSYACVERRLKGWISATVSVLVADYAFITGFYSLFILCAGWWQRGRKNGTRKPQ